MNKTVDNGTCALMSISPIDGRYRNKLSGLRKIFSEYGLIKYRLIVEVMWLRKLSELTSLHEVAPFTNEAKQLLQELVDKFNIEDAEHIKTIEKETNHDVKSVEYFIKEKCSTDELKNVVEFIHFGCTSEDINNLAYALMLNETRKTCLLPTLTQLISSLEVLAHQYADLVMLSRTHGQAATPTTLGKEMANFVARLKRQYIALEQSPILGKMNGATGNYSALQLTYPDIDWRLVSKTFVESLDLTWNDYTTQIEPHDYLSEFFAILLRINTILIDFSRDIWSYISIKYFSQKSKATEVGSSTMPHKINPIDFENAEGNLGIANALLSHMMEKLPISRWQRDLSDSTVLRNIGVALAHSLLSYEACLKGIAKLAPNEVYITQDLENHWEVLAEAIQMVMRRYGIDEPYEKLKAFTRGKQISKENLHSFIKALDLPQAVKDELLDLTPKDYIGYAKELAKKI